MPRRTSNRLRGSAAAAGSNNPAGAFDCEVGGSNGGGAGSGDGQAMLCPPLPPSPGKRKTRSPVEEIQHHGGLLAPSDVKCMSLAFQSPKKKASGDRSGGGGGGGILNPIDRLNATPFDKENDLDADAAGGGGGASAVATAAPLALALGDPSSHGRGFLQNGAGAVGGAGGSIRFSAFSAFSHAPKPSCATAHSSGSSSSIMSTREGAKRRTREESTTPGRGAVPTPTVHASPNLLAVADLHKPSPLPFLLPPANITNSPDLGKKSGSRRARRVSRVTRSPESSNSSNGSASPALTPATRSMPCRVATRAAAAGRCEATPEFTPILTRGRSLSGAGCAAGGRRAASNAAGAASPPPRASGGGPAGACRGGCDSEPDMSPHRSPIRSPVHRLTESLQKWAPGSRYSTGGGGAGARGAAAAAAASGERDKRRHSASSVAGAAAAAAAASAFSVGNVRAGVGASWSGQELRRTLEQERVGSAAEGAGAGGAAGGGQGHRRARSHTTEEVMFPQDRFRDSPAYSPISPASSVGSINLANGEDGAGDGIRGFSFGAGGGTPSSAGRPWRSSPSRASRDGEGIRGSANSGGGDGPVGTVERFAMVRMEGSWSDDEDGGGGPSGTALRLAFSPGGSGGREAAGAGARSGTGAAAASSVAAAAATLSTGAWRSPFSPVKGKRAVGAAVFSGGEVAAGAIGSSVQYSEFSLLGSPVRSRVARRSSLGPDSPEDHSLHSVRDLMDEGTDEEEEGGGEGGRLSRRRRRRGLPGGLRALEMPDASADSTVVDGEGGAACATSGGSMMMMMTMDDDDDVTVTACDNGRGGLNTTDNTTVASTTLPFHTTPNPFVSPAEPAGHKWSLSGTDGGVEFDNSSCPTTCLRWDHHDASGATGPLESTRIDADEAPSTLDETWTRDWKGKGKNSAANAREAKGNWEPSMAGFGSSSSPEGRQDMTEVSDNSGSSGAALGIDDMSGLSGADTSGTSDASASFKSRPIPDQVQYHVLWFISLVWLAGGAFLCSFFIGYSL